MNLTEIRHTRKKLAEVHHACELRTQHFERLLSEERIEESTEDNYRWFHTATANASGVAGGMIFGAGALNTPRPGNALHELVSFFVHIDTGPPPGIATLYFSFDSTALFKGAIPAHVNAFWAANFNTQHYAKQFARRMIIPRGSQLCAGATGLTSGQNITVVVYTKIHYPNPRKPFLARPGGF